MVLDHCKVSLKCFSMAGSCHFCTFEPVCEDRKKIVGLLDLMTTFANIKLSSLLTLRQSVKSSTPKSCSGMVIFFEL